MLKELKYDKIYKTKIQVEKWRKVYFKKLWCIWFSRDIIYIVF